jgi:branched-chain amino acid transport system ATP-binding protein
VRHGLYTPSLAFFNPVQVCGWTNSAGRLRLASSEETSGPRAAAEMGSILSIRDVGKRFGGVRAVGGCSFEVGHGTITGLIGPNGAGKTTLFNMIAGFIKPNSGQVLLDGADVTGLAPHRLFRRGLVRTFQIPHEFERLTVLDNLMLVPSDRSGESIVSSWFRWSRVCEEERRIREKADEVLEFLQLTRVRDAFAGNLSGGQKKLLELGRTMMTDARLVLLDEPGAGVNPTLMARLVADIRRLNVERGYTFCIIEHDMDLIAALCDPVVVMAEGKVLTEGSMAEVRRDPRVIEAYFGGSAAPREIGA